MKYIFLFFIKFYQTFTPKTLRGKCLFRESCSNHVYRVTKELGFRKGMEAFIFRIKNCRPGFYLTENKGKILLITVNNEVVEEDNIDKRIIITHKKEFI